MSLTLADVRSAVVRNLGGDTNTEYDVNLANIDLNTIINEANHQIEAEADFPWLVTTETVATVNGTNLYTPTAGWYRTKALSDPNYGPLKYVSLDDMEQRWPTLTNTGIPWWYAEVAGQLDIRPTPNAVLSLRHVYFQTEPELIDDTDEPLLPNQFRGYLVCVATRLAAERLRIWAIAQNQASKEPAWQKRMLDDKRRSIATTSVRVRGGTWPASW